MSRNQLLETYKNERQATEIYSRVMGYYTCRNRYNDSKKQEAKDRTYFEVELACPKCAACA